MDAAYLVPGFILSMVVLAAVLLAWQLLLKPKPFPGSLPSPIPFLRLISPNGDEQWPLITQQPITWESFGLSGLVDLVLLRGELVGPGAVVSKEMGHIVNGIALSNGSYLWQVGDYIGGGYPPPNVGTGSAYKIRIKTAGGSYVDDSDDFFSILAPPALVLASPKGGIWQSGNHLNIAWWARNFPPGTTVRLELYKDLAYLADIAKDIAAEAESFVWNINETPGIAGWSGYGIRIATMQTFWDYYFWKEVSDFSKEQFRILDYELIEMATMYEGNVSYRRTGGFWLRDDPSVVTDPGWYNNYADGFSDGNVKKLVSDMGCPAGAPVSDSEIWDRIALVWNWLKAPGHIAVDSAEFDQIGPGWPSISALAKYYVDHGHLVWAACASKALVFANLLIQLRVPQSCFVTATARHNIDVEPAVSMHEYIGIYLNGRWFHLDPMASQTKEIPDFKHACSVGVDAFITRVDYEHPYHIDAPPECSDPVLLTRVAPYLPK